MRATLIPWLVPFWVSSGVQVWGQAVHVMMCCIVCSSPHRHRMSALSSSPHFFKLSFVRSIPVLRLKCAPNQPCLILTWWEWFVWHPTRGTAYLISPSGRSFFFKVFDVIAFVWLIKIFLDLRRKNWAVSLYMVCYGFDVIFVLSQFAYVTFLFDGGTIPESVYNYSTGEIFSIYNLYILKYKLAWLIKCNIILFSVWWPAPYYGSIFSAELPQYAISRHYFLLGVFAREYVGEWTV